MQLVLVRHLLVVLNVPDPLVAERVQKRVVVKVCLPLEPAVWFLSPRGARVAGHGPCS